MASLPRGWETSIDPESGRTFYINHDTKQTSWTPPVEEPLPQGWEERRDPQGRTYFIDHNTQETSWTDPRTIATSATMDANYPTFDPVPEVFSHQAVNESSTTDGWKCLACTFINANDAMVCDMCGSGRNGEAPSDVGVGYESDENDSSLMVTDPRQLTPYVVPDEEWEACWKCEEKFTFKNRRHHCKCCGLIFCAKCSAKKAVVSLFGNSDEKKKRCCERCFDHLESGEQHCFLRYMTIIEHGRVERTADRAMAMRGIADLIGNLPKAITNSASVMEAQSAFNTIEAIEIYGGISELFILLDPGYPSDILTQGCRIISNLTKASLVNLDGNSPISLQNLLRELCDGSALASMQAILSKSSTSVEAQIEIAKVIYRISDQPEIQLEIRNAGLIAPLSDSLLASNATLQEYALKSIQRLIVGNGPGVDSLVECGGVQPLTLLLSSDNNEQKALAAQALASALSVNEGSNASTDILRASNVREALITVGGAGPSVQLLGSHDPNVVRAGLQLCQSISESQTEILKSAGIIPLIVALLASRDSGVQNQAAHLLYTVASTTGQSGQHEILDSGGLSMSLPLLSSQSSLARRYSTALCDLFAGDEIGAGIILESPSTLKNLVSILNQVVSQRNLGDDGKASVTHAAAALTQLLNLGPNEKAAVIEAGGLEALMSLHNKGMGSQVLDPDIIRQVVYAMYSFVSDDELINDVAKRIAPPTLAMKLVNMLSSPSMLMDQQTLEMLLLTVAILCGAKQDDHIDALPDQSSSNVSNQEQNRVVVATAAQTQELIAANGLGSILPLLSGAQPPPVVLATLRVILALSNTPKGAERIANAGGIGGTVNALSQSLSYGQSEPVQLHQQLRLYAITAFGSLCNAKAGNGKSMPQNVLDDIRRGLTVLKDCISTHTTIQTDMLRYAAVRSVRELSFNSANWDALATYVLPVLLELLLEDRSNGARGTTSMVGSATGGFRSYRNDLDGTIEAGSELSLLMDIAVTISNLAKLENHCTMVLESGGIFALVSLLSEHSDEAVSAGIKSLSALSESSKPCRSAIVDLKAGNTLLQIAEQRGGFNEVEEDYSDDEDAIEMDEFQDEEVSLAEIKRQKEKRRMLKQLRRDLPLDALKCLALLSKDPTNGSKLTQETGATDTLLRLMKSPNTEIGGEALGVLLKVAQGSDTLWEQIMWNADIQSSVTLLQMGPPGVKGHACSTVAALCEASSGLSLCESPAVLEAIPSLVKLLTPADHLGANTTESPSLEAAAACVVLGKNGTALNTLYQNEFVEALILLVLRERRLGRPRNATMEHSIRALNMFCKSFNQKGYDAEDMEDEEPMGYQELWSIVRKLNKRKDFLDAMVIALDAHTRDYAKPPAGCSVASMLIEICQILASVPRDLANNEINLLGRASRPLALALEDSCPSDSDEERNVLHEQSLHVMTRLVKEKGLPRLIANGGGVRAAAQILAPLSKENGNVEEIFSTSSKTFLEAALLLSFLVKSSNDKTVDDAVVKSNAVPALVSLLSVASNAIFDENEMLSSAEALTASLEAISSLSTGGAVVRKNVMSCTGIVDALSGYIHPTGTEQLMQSFLSTDTLCRLCELDEHRIIVIDEVEGIREELIASLKDCVDGMFEDTEGATVSDLVRVSVELLYHLFTVDPEDSNLCNSAVVVLWGILSQYDDVEIMTATLEALHLIVSRTTQQMVEDDSMFKTVESLLGHEHSSVQNAILRLLYNMFQATHSRCQDIAKILVSKMYEVDKMNMLQLNLSVRALHQFCLSTENRTVLRDFKQGRLATVLKRILREHHADSILGYEAKMLLKLLGVSQTLEKIVVRKQIKQVEQVAPPQPAVVPPPAHQARPLSKPLNMSRKPSAASVMTTASERSKPALPTFSASSPPLPSSSAASMQVPLAKKKYVLAPSSQVGLNNQSSDDASLRLAMQLQREEEARSGRNVTRHTNPPPKPPKSEWSCSECTYNNPIANAKCEMCGASKPTTSFTHSSMPPPPPPSYNSLSSNSTVDVRCACGLTLRAPSSASMVRCPTCSRETPI